MRLFGLRSEPREWTDSMPAIAGMAVRSATSRTRWVALGLAVCVALAASVSLLGLGTLTAATSDPPAKSEASKPDTSKSGKKMAAFGPKASSYGIAQIELINEKIREGWAGAGITPSAPATDGEWIRRLFLDVLGRTPTVDEALRFMGDKTPDKRLQIVNKLLSDDEKYVEEYARNWTTIWTNVLIGRAGGGEQDRMTNRPGMQQSLRRAFKRNMPYDRLVAECISATGVNKSGEEGFNGFVNFLSGKLDENGVQATAKTAQIFLGLQVQCTQCHNHPFNDWKQNQFWEMNAFFRQTRGLRRYEGGRDVAIVELVNQDFAGEDNHPEEAVLYYELRNGKLQAAYPVFVDGTKVKSSGYLEEVNRRTELARLVTGSEYMPKEIVNRMWGHFLGYGFTKPIDDIGPHNVPTHPELLDTLGKEFRQHSTDLKELIRWIVLSEPYSLSSKFSATNKKDDPSLGEKPLFSHFYLRQMRVEELYESLLTATEAHKTGGSYEDQEKVKHEWLSQFTIAFGTDENDETTTFNGSIPQALMMMNGDLIKKAIGTDKGSFLEQVADNGKLNNAAKINFLFMAALTRKPSSTETTAANQLAALRGGDSVAALQDVWWAVLNSNEFILNH
jgi:hypothetical protein